MIKLWRRIKLGKILWIILIILVIANTICFIYGKKAISSNKSNKEVTDEDYKKGMRYVIFSLIISFLTIILVTIIGMNKLLS